MKQYLGVISKILSEGREKESGRANMPNTIGISNANITMDMADGFPLLTTKKMFWKGIVHELLWFLRGETNIKYLVDNKVNIWNGDAYRWYKKHYEEQKLSKEYMFNEDEFKEKILNNELTYISKHSYKSDVNYKLGDLGKVYGYNWRTLYKEVDPDYSPSTRPVPTLREGLKKTYLGVANGSGKEGDILKKTWEGMISRCYDEKSRDFYRYGGRNIYVCDEWLEFKKFKEDCEKLPNWDLKKKSPRDYVLDKDGVIGSYCYSPSTCRWVTPQENSNLKNDKIYVVEKEGIKYKFDNPKSFCDSMGIDNRNFSSLWTKNAKSRYGFTLVSVNTKKKYVKYDQIKHVIDGLKNNPYSRYHIIDGWDIRNYDESALMPCHLLYQFIVKPMILDERNAYYAENIGNGQFFNADTDEKVEAALNSAKVPKFYLDLNTYQRSSDTALGVPFNLASMSLLLMIIAKTTNMVAGVANWVGGDTHLYLNHVEKARQQTELEPMKLPNMLIKRDIKTIEDIEKLSIDDFELVGYKSHPKIDFELFTGVKKK